MLIFINTWLMKIIRLLLIEQVNVGKMDSLLRLGEANEVPISSHIWVASSTFKQL